MHPWPGYPDTPELIVAAPGPISAQHRTWHRDRNKTGLAGFELPALLAPFFFEPKEFFTAAPCTNDGKEKLQYLPWKITTKVTTHPRRHDPGKGPHHGSARTNDMLS